MVTAVVRPLQLHLVQAADLSDQCRRCGGRGPVRRLRRLENFGSDFPWRNSARQVGEGRVDRVVIIWRGEDTLARKSLQENRCPSIVERQMSQRVADRPTVR